MRLHWPAGMDYVISIVKNIAQNKVKKLGGPDTVK